MSIIDQIKKSVSPDARLWIEEALFRGAPADGAPWGVIKGAHFTIGIEQSDLHGEVTRRVLGPYPASEIEAEIAQGSALGDLLKILDIKQQHSLDVALAKLDAAPKELADAVDAARAEERSLRDTQLSEQKEQFDAALIEVNEAHKAKQQTSSETIQSLTGQLAVVTKERDALGTTEQGQRLARDIEKKNLREQIAAAQAKHDKLESIDTGGTKCQGSSKVSSAPAGRARRKPGKRT